MRKPPDYITELLENQLQSDLANRRTTVLPKYDPLKIDLPKRSNFIGSISWLKAVQKTIGDSFIFALDKALMCQGSFGGRSDEYLVWGYGDHNPFQWHCVA